MNQRPRSITVIAWLFIAVGVVTLTGHLWQQHASDSARNNSLEPGLVWGSLVRAVAIVGGAFMLRGFNWARWLMVLWMVFHVGLSFLHSVFQVLFHTVLFGLIGYLLFRPEASAYFTGRGLKAGAGEAAHNEK